MIHTIEYKITWICTRKLYQKLFIFAVRYIEHRYLTLGL